MNAKAMFSIFSKMKKKKKAEKLKAMLYHFFFLAFSFCLFAFGHTHKYFSSSCIFSQKSFLVFLRDHMGWQGSSSGQSPERQVLYSLYYLSGPVTLHSLSFCFEGRFACTDFSLMKTSMKTPTFPILSYEIILNPWWC